MSDDRSSDDRPSEPRASGARASGARASEPPGLEEATTPHALTVARRIPLPAGYVWSALELRDAAEIVELLNADSMEKLGRNDRTVDEFRADWEEPGIDPGADGIVIRALPPSTRIPTRASGSPSPPGPIVGYEEVYDKNRHAELIFYGAVVHRDHRSAPLRDALLEWVWMRAAEHLEQAPPDVEVKVFTGIDSRDEEGRVWLETNDLDCDRVFRVMRKDLTNPLPTASNLPAEYELCLREREDAEPEFLRRFYQTQWRAFHDHWGAPVPFEKSFQTFLHHLESRQERDDVLLTYVTHETEIVSTCLTLTRSDSDPDVAFLDRLATDAPHRGRGLARALLQDAFIRCRALGKKAIELSVDSDSKTGAPRLYEGVGMVETEKTFVMSRILREGRQLSPEDDD